MPEIDRNIRNIEQAYWMPNTECIEVTALYRATSPQIVRKCRVGFDQIDLFMLNAKKCKEREAFRWHIDLEDFQSLSSSSKNSIWFSCLLAYFFLEKGMQDHPVILKIQEDLICWALMQKKSDHPELSVRALRHAIALGSEEARTHMTTDDYDEYFQENLDPVYQKMDLS